MPRKCTDPARQRIYNEFPASRYPIDAAALGIKVSTLRNVTRGPAGPGLRLAARMSAYRPALSVEECARGILPRVRWYREFQPVDLVNTVAGVSALADAARRRSFNEHLMVLLDEFGVPVGGLAQFGPVSR